MNSLSPVKIWRRQKDIASCLGKEGKIISWTIVRTPPMGYEGEAPYPVVLVELGTNQKKIGQLVDWQKKDLKTGRRVRVVYRRTKQTDPEGVIPYGIKFKPK